MSARSSLWNTAKKCVTIGLIGVTVKDRYVSIAAVRGGSMSPSLNPVTDEVSGSRVSTFDDYVLVEKFCLGRYRFSHGDVVIFTSPTNHKERHIKRIIGLPGDWVGISHIDDVMRVPEGHCWVEGDNLLSSLDSRSLGPIPLGLIRGRVTHVVWPPSRIGRVKREIRQPTVPSY
ncbi:mitochondrial inner membrane protease subunit 2 [Punica granatum]|uniref:Mitochondrial inner membrane protease subunit 2 n=2 Tax=Punica granatum TaxID=22663 RepID=A0A2I0HSP7_PUNGR|nr:mitochondrial inner membrane protease subunit 2 [Punica granatum]PKI34520.1 hypothetical protein CRG98_045057 [Punica granatum]